MPLPLHTIFNEKKNNGDCIWGQNHNGSKILKNPHPGAALLSFHGSQAIFTLFPEGGGGKDRSPSLFADLSTSFPNVTNLSTHAVTTFIILKTPNIRLQRFCSCTTFPESNNVNSYLPQQLKNSQLTLSSS